MIACIRWFVDVSLNSARQFYSGRYSYQSSALAYTTLLTLVPIFSVAIYAISTLPAFNTLFESVKHYAFTNFIPSSSAVIEKNLNIFTRHATKLPITSLIFLAFSVLLLVRQVKNIINAIWGSPKYNSLIISIGHSLAIVAMPVMIGIGIFVSSYLFRSALVTETAGKLGFDIVIPFILSIVINTLTFTTLYILLPSRHVNISSGLFGGLIAAIFFEIAKAGFALYINVFPTYELIYGALAAIPIFLIWLYIAWSIIIYGAILSKNYQQ